MNYPVARTVSPLRIACAESDGEVIFTRRGDGAMEAAFYNRPFPEAVLVTALGDEGLRSLTSLLQLTPDILPGTRLYLDTDLQVSCTRRGYDVLLLMASRTFNLVSIALGSAERKALHSFMRFFVPSGAGGFGPDKPRFGL